MINPNAQRAQLHAEGISVLICCYNSEKRLGPTLQALAGQLVDGSFQVEILVIDNASTDGTFQLAESICKQPAFPFASQVLRENRKGKSNAIELGFKQATYKYLAIVDDDNWLAPDYLALAWSILEADTRIGAVGGVGEPAYDVTPPAWFSRFAIDYAAAPQAPRSGDITRTNRYLYGAGTVLRKQVWENIKSQGFESLLTEAHGSKASGEDNEMCYALIFDGYKIWYDERLRFQHFIPAERLTWQYMLKTYRGNATSEIDLRPWTHFLDVSPALPEVPTLVWLRNGLYMLRYMLTFLGRAVRRGELGKEGSADSIRAFYYWLAFRECLRREWRRDQGFYKAREFIARLRRHALS